MELLLLIPALLLTGLWAGQSGTDGTDEAPARKADEDTTRDDILTRGPDIWEGTPDADSVNGRAGSDSLDGRAGDDVLLGGAGEDRIGGGFGADLIYGGDDINNLYGMDGRDQIFGGDTLDNISGGDGDDSIRAGDGFDNVWGGAGNDVAALGRGGDHTFDDPGDDRWFGGSGDDTLSDALGEDRFYGGWGNDRIVTIGGSPIAPFAGQGDSGPEGDRAFGGIGRDSFRLDDADIATGGSDSDLFFVKVEGDDFAPVTIKDYHPEDLVVVSTTGAPTNGYWSVTRSGADSELRLFGKVVVRFDGVQDLSVDDLILEEVERGDNIVGTALDDTLRASAGSDRVFGGSGDDRVIASPDGADGDLVYLGDGDDTTSAESFGVGRDYGAGHDRIFGGAGKDSIGGGAGDDRVFGGDGADFIDDMTGSDRIFAGNGNDRIDGGDPYDIGADRIFGGAGDDLLTGANGDILTGGEGDDRFGHWRHYLPEDDWQERIIVKDFTPGQDVLFARFEPDPDSYVPELRPDGRGGTLVTVAGHRLFHLLGVKPDELGPSDFDFRDG